MLRYNILQFNRLSPITRSAIIDAVLICGLMAAGLYMPGGSASASADEQNQTANAAGKAHDSPLQEESRGPILIYQASADPAGQGEGKALNIDMILRQVDRRVNYGSKKIAHVTAVDQSKIAIALPDNSDDDVNRVKTLMGYSGWLEFRIIANERDHKSLIERALKEPDKSVITDANRKREAWWVPVREGHEASISYPNIAKRERTVDHKKVTEVLVVQDQYNVTNQYLDHAGAGKDHSGRPDIEFSLTKEGGELFSKLSGENTPDETTGFSRHLAIILDGHLYAAPGLRSRIFDRGVIEGVFTQQEVDNLVDVLNAGRMLVSFKLLEEKASKHESEKAATKEGQLRPQRLYPPWIDAEAAGQEALRLYDTNNDGKISGAEFDKVPSLASAQALAGFKTTKEKGIIAADIAARIKAWQATKVGRIGGIVAQVTRGGKPLVGAAVKFVPENFLGGNLPVCTGTTGPDGTAQITESLSDPGDPPGVPPGYYRVEINMPDGSIPAKYNTETILGEEVCPDVRRAYGYVYEIK